MKPYQELVARVRCAGTLRGDRTGVGTWSTFGDGYTVDLRDGFPLLTTKRVFFKGVLHELLWFLSGDTKTDYLCDHGVHIWDEWATAEQSAKFGRSAGDLGPVYGHQWRNFGATVLPDGTYARDGKDQIAWVVGEIRRNPGSRRLIVSGWNPREADQVALPPCHTLFQFYVSDGRLDCQLYQRSGDVFLGVPFNLASYALLTSMVACVTGLEPGFLHHRFGDLHLYRNHEEQARLQLSRTPRALPTLKLSPRKSIFDFGPSDVEICGYAPHPAIKAEVAV